MEPIKLAKNIESLKGLEQSAHALAQKVLPELVSTSTSLKIETAAPFAQKPLQLSAAQAYLPKKAVADYIEFEPAKTIEEAEKFAKYCLGVKEFRLGNLDCANYINEALAKNYNGSTDKSVIIVSYSPSSDFLATIRGRYLKFNEDTLSVLDKSLEKYKGKKAFQILYSDDLSAICDLSESQMKYLNYFKNNMYNELPFDEKIGYCMFLRSFGRDGIPLTSNGKLAVPDGGKFWIMNHEIGHARHRNNIGAVKFGRMRDDFIIQLNSVEDLIKKFSEIEPEWKSTQKVSDYATQSPVEFVAEVYACLLNGYKFDNDVMRLYEKYGGPKVIL